MSDFFTRLRDNWPIIVGVSVLVSVLVSAYATLYIQGIVKAAIIANNELVSPREQQFRLDLSQALDDAGDNKTGLERMEGKLDRLIDLMMARTNASVGNQ